MSDALAAIRMMLQNNMGRPLAPSVLIDQLRDEFSPSQVRRAMWKGHAAGELEFTDGWAVRLPSAVVGPTGGDRDG